MKNYMGVCPFCEEENLNYGTIELEGDHCYFPRECCECGAKGEEWYSMDFIGQENLEKGILDANQKENEVGTKK